LARAIVHVIDTSAKSPFQSLVDERFRLREQLRRRVRDVPDLLQNKSALECDLERRAGLRANVIDSSVGMNLRENETATLFHLEHA
jgi:hypothetical protein